MNGRDIILSRLRDARHASTHASRDDSLARTKIRQKLTNRSPTGPVPAMRQERDARITHFARKAKSASAEVLRVENLSELPGLLREALRSRNLPPALRMGDEPVLGGLDWTGFETSRGPGRLDEPATISRAAFGVAETGTIVLLSGAENPITLALLGEHHYAVLRESDVVCTYEEVWNQMRKDGLDPRTVNLVTGPSRSADIEQKLELGAHGPISLTIILAGGA